MSGSGSTSMEKKNACYTTVYQHLDDYSVQGSEIEVRRRRMKFIFKKRYIKRILLGTFLTALVLFILVFVIVPVVYRSSYSFQRSLLFLNFVSVPVDFKNPSKSGLLGTRNFYIKTPDNVTLGVWHTLPTKQIASLLIRGVAAGGSLSDSVYDELLTAGDPIFIYMHGNSGNRGSSHRVDLYKMLQANNYHVISFDYRSYGDSSAVGPSEEGVVRDSKAIYNWVKGRSKNTKIFFWGHSLGTGISSRTLYELDIEGEKISGLILESPFNNLKEEIESYPMAQLFKFLPWFDFFFTEPMYENGLRFESDKHLRQVKTPICIIHAEDDVVVPYKLGLKLYHSLKDSRINGTLTKFISYPKSHGYGHKFIVRDKNLPAEVQSFIKESAGYE